MKGRAIQIILVGMKYFVLGMLSSDGILCAAMLLGVRKLMYKVHSRKKGNNSRTERNVICIKISILKWDLLAQGRYRTPWLYLASTTNYISMYQLPATERTANGHAALHARPSLSIIPFPNSSLPDPPQWRKDITDAIFSHGMDPCITDFC